MYLMLITLSGVGTFSYSTKQPKIKKIRNNRTAQINREIAQINKNILQIRNRYLTSKELPSLATSWKETLSNTYLMRVLLPKWKQQVAFYNTEPIYAIKASLPILMSKNDTYDGLNFYTLLSDQYKKNNKKNNAIDCFTNIPVSGFVVTQTESTIKHFFSYFIAKRLTDVKRVNKKMKTLSLSSLLSPKHFPNIIEILVTGTDSRNESTIKMLKETKKEAREEARALLLNPDKNNSRTIAPKTKLIKRILRHSYAKKRDFEEMFEGLKIE